jgi:hypothetical protein
MSIILPFIVCLFSGCLPIKVSGLADLAGGIYGDLFTAITIVWLFCRRKVAKGADRVYT